MGKVYLTGAGPGDPSLITLKALAALKTADCVLYDSLINPELLNYCAETCEKIHVGKRKGVHSMKQEEINDLLVQKARENRVVVRLKGGDPFIFGRGGEELQYLAQYGIETEVIPGVTSASAASAQLKMPLTHRALGPGVVFLSGYSRENPNHNGLPAYDWKALVANHFTLVIYMGLHNAKELAECLMAAGMPETTLAAALGNLSLADEQVLISNVGNLGKDIEQTGIRFPALLVIGDVLKIASVPEPSVPQNKVHVLFVFHGSQNPGSAPNLLVEETNKILGASASRAYLSGGSKPALSDELARVCSDTNVNEVLIYPFLVLPGKHLDQDIPDVVEKARKSYPRKKITLRQPAGLLEEIKGIVLEEIRFLVGS